jgi:hypothetical protein
LIGYWDVVNDSTLNTNTLYTLSRGDSGIISNNYLGEQCGATFDFFSNGNLVTSFFNCGYGNPLVDSAKYVQTGNQVTISIFAQYAGCCVPANFIPVITRTYTISNLTANSATLTFQSFYYPASGGASGMVTDIINLKK